MKERSPIKFVGSSRLSIPFLFFIFWFCFLHYSILLFDADDPHTRVPSMQESLRPIYSFNPARLGRDGRHQWYAARAFCLRIPFRMKGAEHKRHKNAKDIFWKWNNNKMNSSLLLQLNRKNLKLFDWIYSLLVCLFFVLLHPAEYLGSGSCYRSCIAIGFFF